MTLPYRGGPKCCRASAASIKSQVVGPPQPRYVPLEKLCAAAAPNTEPARAVGAERKAVKLAGKSITPSCSAPSIALGTWSHRCLTPRSTGAPTAGHQALAGGTRYIFTSPGLASCRRRPVTSNVRPRKNTPRLKHHRGVQLLHEKAHTCCYQSDFGRAPAQSKTTPSQNE